MTQETLDQLRPVMLPDQTFWWPLAPGWWALIIILFITVASGIYLFKKQRTNQLHTSLKNQAIEKVESAWLEYNEKKNINDFISSIVAICKQCILLTSLDSKRDAYSQTPIIFFKFLNKNYPDFFENPDFYRLFEEGAYGNMPTGLEEQSEQLKNQIIAWINVIQISDDYFATRGHNNV